MTEATGTRRSARDYLGQLPWPLIEELQEGDEIEACYLVHESRRLLSKSNQPYLRIALGDRTGTIEAMVWDDVEQWGAICTPGATIGVRGRISSYQDRPQLRMSSIEALELSAEELAYLVPSSKRDREVMERELDAQIASIRERPLRALLRRCLGRESELGRRFREHPAATRNHHAYLHGLLEHTLSVAGICQHLVEHYRDQGVALDRDLLVTGALLHDLGKIEELEGAPLPSYTTAGRLLGHIVIGIEIVGREGARISGLDPERLLLVQHLIASHQGKPEWDSPRLPQILEAMVLHYADDLDAKVNQIGATLAAVEPGEWSGYDRAFARAFYLPGQSSEGQSGRGASTSDSVIDLFRG